MTTASLNLTLSLNDIALDPSKAQTLSPDQAQDMLFMVGGLIPFLVARTSQISTDSQPQKKELITVKQAAEIIKMSPDWIYRNKGSLPYVVKVGGSIRINQAKLDKAINKGWM
jgi:predicted DNA-binding transcriptional regulator AlpA